MINSEIDYVFARDAKFLKLESASDKQLLEITNLRFKLGHMGFHTIANSIQKLWYSNLHCKKNNHTNPIFRFPTEPIVQKFISSKFSNKTSISFK